MKLTIAIIVVFAGLASSGCRRTGVANDAEIAQLEASIKLEQLPEWKNGRLPPLSGYARYYAASWNGGRVILGELVVGSTRTPGVYKVRDKSDFPEILDGGCAVVNLVYSVEKQTIISIRCNGFA